MTVALCSVLCAGAASGVFNVRDFGAVGDGVQLDTTALNRAVEACARAGGGTVHVPSGTYLTGTVHLKSDVTLSIDAGAVLLGSRNVKDYQTAVDGMGWYAALILAKGVHNASVVGHGIIDGNKVFNPEGEERMRGPHSLLFFDCRDVVVKDVSFRDAANYAVVLRSCEGVNIDGITTRGGWDGINMHDTRNATIANCRIFTGDDALAGAYWENVTVTNCVLNTSCNAFRVGGRNVVVNNVFIYGPGEFEHRTSKRRNLESGFQILPHRAMEGTKMANKVVAPGPVDNMVLSNITMVNVRSPFWIAYSADAPYSAKNLGVRRIIVNNLTVTGAGKTPFYVSAPPENPMKSIVLNNVRMTFAGGATERDSQGQGFSPYSILQSSGIYLRNVEQAEMHNVRIGYEQKDLRPVVFGENVGELELVRFVAPRDGEGAPSFLFAGIRRLVMDGQPVSALKATVRDLVVDAENAIAGEPFHIAATVFNAGKSRGLADVPLKTGDRTMTRSIWLEPGETARLLVPNVRHAESGEIAVIASGVSKKLRILPRPEMRTPSAEYKSFLNTDGELGQTDAGLYVRAAGDASVLDRADHYGTIYLPKALPSVGSVVVRLENPGLRGSWGGRAGVMVRSDISSAGRAPGYLILGSSPSNGTSLEWDSDGDGLIDRNTPLDGYTLWPHWLRLERNGSQFAGYTSRDGETWTRVGEVNLPGANGNLDAGVFAHRSAARFTDLKVTR
jgi:hypothetical protein